MVRQVLTLLYPHLSLLAPSFSSEELRGNTFREYTGSIWASMVIGKMFPELLTRHMGDRARSGENT